MNTSYYVALGGNLDFIVNRKEGCALCGNNTTARLATEKEKEKLFQAIKDNGYSWNPETKTLDKLVVLKFKVGDKIRHKTHMEYKSCYVARWGKNWMRICNGNVNFYLYCDFLYN